MPSQNAKNQAADAPRPTLPKLPERSEKALKGVHPELVAVIREAYNGQFVVTEGLRTEERQKQLKAEQKSWTLNSRHLTGHAVDLMALNERHQGTWDWERYVLLANDIRAAADKLDVKIVWGGDWKVRDGVHFELDRKAYPVETTVPKATSAVKKK